MILHLAVSKYIKFDEFTVKKLQKKIKSARKVKLFIFFPSFLFIFHKLRFIRRIRFIYGQLFSCLLKGPLQSAQEPIAYWPDNFSFLLYLSSAYVVKFYHLHNSTFLINYGNFSGVFNVKINIVSHITYVFSSFMETRV